MMIADLIAAQSNPTIATYAKTGEVHLRVTARAENEDAAELLMKPILKELRVRFGDHIYTMDERVTLEDAVAALLREQELTVTTVESCTGGLLAGRLVNVPGVSEVFKQGFVTYSNKAKRKLGALRRRRLRNSGRSAIGQPARWQRARSL